MKPAHKSKKPLMVPHSHAWESLFDEMPGVSKPASKLAPSDWEQGRGEK